MKLSSSTRVFVTGACGFIGSHLVEQLIKLGCRVKALVGYNHQNSLGSLEDLDKDILKSVEILAGNIQDPFFVQKAVKGADVVFHLAALIGIPYSYVSPSSYIDTNIKGSLHVLQACLDNGVRKLVHTSTSEVYGTAKYTPIDENHPLQGQSPYSASKIAADKLAESYFCSFQLPVTTIRPFNTYGPRQSARAIIPTVISQIAAGQKKIKLGSLTPVRDFNFVSDTVAGYIAIAESDQTVGEVINIGTGKGTSIGDTVRLIANLMKADVEIICDENRVRPSKSEVMALICNNSKALKLTGWKPKYSLEEGLGHAIRYVESKINQYNVEAYNI